MMCSRNILKVIINFLLIFSVVLFVSAGSEKVSDLGNTDDAGKLLEGGNIAKKNKVVENGKREKKTRVVPVGTKIMDQVAAEIGPQTEEETQAIEKTIVKVTESMLLNNDILAYYGHPNSKNMGILGRLSKEDLLARLTLQAEVYKAESGGKDIIKAFYIIYGTCWPGGDIGIISDSKLREYIDFALANNMLVFLDHQIGKFDPVDSLKKMLPYLKEYPNVHLGLDPEWRTTKPMEEIGSVSGEEINNAQKAMEDYMIENKIEGERLLVIHQFNNKMITGRKSVKADFENVRPVLCMDGHGSPELKRGTYAYNAEAKNIPIKAFKLFYDEPGNTGVDVPILSPKEVYELDPRPTIIMYQ
ncbi:MAG: hypothetical protein Ta2B_06700 [Termitinemataceae bacterium]|nr:MAG: hypothetical protein Ta2B_06700 [Termitinemataceae bacterium]